MGFENSYTMQKLFEIIVRLIVVLTALPFHEFAHAFVAHKLGDDTAKAQGRLTLNPLAHLDPIGALALLLFGFGWAKPVPINPYRFKNRKFGMAISSLAGPVSNLVLAFGIMLLAKIVRYGFGFGDTLMVTVYSVFMIMISINLGLAVFNLLPFPPLDGSRIATLFLPERIYFQMMQYERWLFLVLIVLINTPVFDTVLRICTNALWRVLNDATSWVDWIAQGLL